MRTLWRLMGVPVALFAAVVSAETQEEVQLDIPPQVLVEALNQWAHAVGFRIISPSAATRYLISPGLQGTYTPQAALQRLLAGTTLTYEFLDENTVAIYEQHAPVVHTFQLMARSCKCL